MALLRCPAPLSGASRIRLLRDIVLILRRLIDSKNIVGSGRPIHCIEIVPLKVEAFVNLPRCCRSCRLMSECADHVLVSCNFAKEVLSWLFRWCSISFPLISCGFEQLFLFLGKLS
ncbi:hypothetical protein L1887_16592 [Cichorium endivia]|nr:hypothetical protein L1887_16592 [Cichorium endivia]